MLRVVYAMSFIDDAQRIRAYVRSRFGKSHADAFTADLNHFCQVLAATPGRGKTNHGYRTTMNGIVHRPNWIFFEYDDEEIRFVHIIEARIQKDSIRF